jgi:hypothetical protein
MLNGYNRHDTALRRHLEAEAKTRLTQAARDRNAMHDAKARADEERRKLMQAQHAKNLAAEARMRDPSITSWQGAVAAVFLLVLTIGIFLAATLLGN